jgi:NRPS condensation-like uncharacterized protein
MSIVPPDARKHPPRQPASIHRSLGPTENIYYLLDKLYCLNFVVFAELDGALNADALARALEAVQREHPLLRARVARVNGRQWFESVPLEQHPLTLEVHPLRNWRGEIAVQMDMPFADAAPLARFLWFGGRGKKSVAAMVFHHSIADGKSGAAVLIEVLRRAGGEDLPLRCRSARPSAQDLDLIKLEGLIRGSLKTLAYWLNQGKSALKAARQLPGYDMSVRPERRITVIPFSMPQKTVRALLAACRANRTTVHGALGAAQLLAIHSEFESAEARNLALNSLADLRGVLSGELTEQDLGLYIATLTTVHGVGAEPDFWPLAADIRDQLKTILHSGDANLVHTILHESSAFPPNEIGARLLQAMVSLAPSSSMLTNIGKIDPIALRNGARVRSVAFVVSPPAQHPVCVTAVSYAGSMYLNLVYDGLKVGEEQARRIVTSLIAFIDMAVAG